MKLVHCVLPILLVVCPLTAENKGTNQFQHLDDRLVLSEQFLRTFFPQLGGRDARLEFQVSMPVTYFNEATHYAKPQGEVPFSVVDLCTQPRQPNVPQIGGIAQVPCTEYDTSYKRPLWGAITFSVRNGHMLPIEGRFSGKLVDDEWPCFARKPSRPADFIERTHLDFLGAFFGRDVKVVKVEGESDALPGTVWIKVGAQNYRHSLYAFYFNECGTVTNFTVRD